MVVMSRHGEERGLQRGITRQVRSMLLKGTLASGPTWDEARGNWTGVMEHHAAGERTRVVCAMAERTETVIVVSAY